MKTKFPIRQVWVMWSAADLWYEQAIADKAFELGKKLAEQWFIVVYGAEKDSDSLSTAAARWAKSVWGITTGITYWKWADIWWEMKELTDVIVCTGMDRWWWREYILVSSCDAIITLGWWSGTLNEVTVAYQKKIPIVCMKWTGWRSDKLADTYLDDRYKNDPARFICKWANTAQEALDYLASLT